MNITEIISLLDELRENCTQGDWKWEYGDDGLDVVTAEEGYKFATFFQAEYIMNTAYVTAIHNNYKALRQAALDGERYRKAGKELINRLEEHLSDTDYPVRHAISAYRQAVKQKEV